MLTPPASPAARPAVERAPGPPYRRKKVSVPPPPGLLHGRRANRGRGVQERQGRVLRPVRRKVRRAGEEALPRVPEPAQGRRKGLQAYPVGEEAPGPQARNRVLGPFQARRPCPAPSSPGGASLSTGRLPRRSARPTGPPPGRAPSPGARPPEATASSLRRRRALRRWGPPCQASGRRKRPGRPSPSRDP